MAIITNPYINAAFQSFQDSSAAPEETKRLVTADVISQLLDRNVNVVFAEEMAKKILSQCLDPSHNADGKRYKFASSNRDKLLRMVFDYSFNHDKEAHITAAEAQIGPFEDFYSPLKRIVYIELPKAVSNVFGSELLQAVVSIATIFGTFYFGYMLFEATTFAFTAHVIPFVINNTPLQVIQFGNAAIRCVELALDNLFPIFLVLFCVQHIVRRLPQEIPYVTAFFNSFSVWNFCTVLYGAPQGLTCFLCDRIVAVANFAKGSMNRISSFFHEIARRGEHERTAVCKARSYQVWNAIVRDNAPQAIVEHSQERRVA